MASPTLTVLVPLTGLINKKKQTKPRKPRTPRIPKPHLHHCYFCGCEAWPDPDGGKSYCKEECFYEEQFFFDHALKEAKENGTAPPIQKCWCVKRNNNPAPVCPYKQPNGCSLYSCKKG
jgi:hypothetical protein